MKNKKNSRRFQIFTTMLILIVILMSQCICIIYHSVLDDNNSSYAVFSSVVSILSILSAFYFLYFITMNTMKDSRQKAELLILEKQQRIKNDQNVTFTKCRQETLTMQQSMKEKLLIYESLMDEGRYEDATLYLEELTSTFQKERFRPICSDTLLNAILTSKRQKAVQYNIQTSFQLLIPENFNIESSDLSSIFFNLMDNAIESCQTSHSEKPFINITARQTANFFTIHMINSKDPSIKFNGKTSKTDSWSHGFGLGIIEEIASKYDGSCQWIDNGEEFQSVVMVSAIPNSPSVIKVQDV